MSNQCKEYQDVKLKDMTPERQFETLANALELSLTMDRDLSSYENDSRDVEEIMEEAEAILKDLRGGKK